MNINFETNKIKREIKMYGKTYKCFRLVKDVYGEVTGDRKRLADITGIFHTQKGYVTNKTKQETIIVSKGQPKIMCLYDKRIDLHINDIIVVNGSDYRVIELNNIEQLNLVFDVSLEKVVKGNEI